MNVSLPPLLCRGPIPLLAACLLGAIAHGDTAKVAKEPALKAEPEVADLEGIYRYSDGGEGVGLVTVKRNKAGIYYLRYSLGKKSQVVGTMDYFGVALRSGDSLSVAWGMQNPANPAQWVRGLSTYRIGRGGVLSGQWCSIPGNGAVASETLTYLAALPLEE